MSSAGQDKLACSMKCEGLVGSEEKSLWVCGAERAKDRDCRHTMRARLDRLLPQITDLHRFALGVPRGWTLTRNSPLEARENLITAPSGGLVKKGAGFTSIRLILRQCWVEGGGGGRPLEALAHDWIASKHT